MVLVKLRVLIVVVMLLAVGGCTVPGKPYSYVDVRVNGPMTSTAANPTPAQGFSLSVPVHNAKASEQAVDFEFRENTDPLDPLSGVVVSSGTLTVPKFGGATATLVRPAQTAAIHTYSLILDPANALAEVYENNNTRTLSVTVEDFDIAIAATGSIDVPPVIGDLTLHLPLSNTTNGTGTPTAVTVTYAILLDGVTSITPTGSTPAIPVPLAADTAIDSQVTVPRPAPGTHTYTITLTSSPADVRTANNVTMLITPTVN